MAQSFSSAVFTPFRYVCVYKCVECGDRSSMHDCKLWKVKEVGGMTHKPQHSSAQLIASLRSLKHFSLVLEVIS